MAKQLIWLNKDNGKVYKRYSHISSKYDIGDTNKYGHELINVLVFETPIRSTTFENYFKSCCKTSFSQSARNKIKFGLINLLKKMISYLNRL